MNESCVESSSLLEDLTVPVKLAVRAQGANTMRQLRGCLRPLRTRVNTKENDWSVTSECKRIWKIKKQNEEKKKAEDFSENRSIKKSW